jgi:hypothetical protein
MTGVGARCVMGKVAKVEISCSCFMLDCPLQLRLLAWSRSKPLGSLQVDCQSCGKPGVLVMSHDHIAHLNS